MGKKTREKRIQSRKNHAKDLARKKLNNKIITIAVLSVVAVIVGYSAFVFSDSISDIPVLPSGVGTLGSEHSHQGIMAMINGEMVDFGIPEYQVKDRLVHFEGQEGYTIHRHATGVPIGYFLETLGFRFNNDCISFEGKDFCSDENNLWQFFVNKKPVDNIQDYVGDEDDRILITYGNPLPEELATQLDMVEERDFKK